MRFNVEHVFRGITRDEYESLYFNEDFNIALCKAVNLARTLVAMERDEQQIDRRVMVGPDREVPKAIQKVLKADRIEYEERIRYKFGSFSGTWETTPNIMASKVISKGGFQFKDNPNGVSRVVTGDIDVKVFGVGGVIEKFILEDVKKSYDDAAKFTQEWVDAGKHKA